ncbi:MAG: mechanosensitive ion channel family protein [Acidobacteriota bacterium]|nr:mechanosensitive ion channel family protein [Acidobacteriota bacterium]
MHNRHLSICGLSLALGLALVLPSALAAQAPTIPPTEQPSAQPPAPDAVDEAEAVAPDSPRTSLRAYLDAARAARWDEAARYLSVPQDQQGRRAELAERLKAVLDRHLWFDLEEISPASTGRLDDGLAAGVEEIGAVQIGDGGATPLRLVRRTDPQGDYWAFTGNVVRQVDAWYDTLEGRWAIDWLTRYQLNGLLETGPFEIMWWQWIALLVVIPIAWIGGRVLGSVTRFILGRLSARTTNAWDDKVFDSIGPPIGVAWTLLLLSALVQSLGLSVPAERVIGQILRGAGVATLFWAIWRLVNIVVAVMLSRPWAAESPSARNMLAIGSNLIKGAVVAMGALAMLGAFGYEVTTVLAGLGIGGLALAFGAQKTVENLFGSMALAVDQPIRVGDFVKVEDFVGTVEDIGLRSTRFRTLDRTLISIPNGSLADQRLESFSARDRMRLATTIGVEYGTTHVQMQQVLEGFERVLRQHPKIWPDAMVIKFKEFGASSLDIEIMAWFDVPTWGDFQLCRQEVLLGFMRVVEEAGTAFAFPTRTVHLINQSGAGVGTTPG